MGLGNDFLAGFLTAFIFLILFFSNPAFAYTLNENGAVYQSVSFADTDPTLSATPVTTSSNSGSTDSVATCSVSKLSPTEAKSILDLTHNGFDGNAITDGTAAEDGEAKDIGDTELIGKELGGNEAVKVNAPQYAVTPDKFSYFDGLSISGPFGIGLIMDDTLRVGRCEGLNQEECRINGNGLSYRTSGTGIVSDFSTAFSSFKETTTKAAAGLTDSEYEAIQNSVIDDNSLTMRVVSVNKGEQIANSFLTRDFSAKTATTCNNNSCTISTYSSFDKYYNAWFSGNMVVTSFGPTLLHGAGKIITNLGFGQGGTADTALIKKLFTGKGTVSTKLKTMAEKVDLLSTSPSTLLGRSAADEYIRISRMEGLAPIFEKYTVGKKLFSSGAGGYTSELFAVDGPLSKLSAEKKDLFFKALTNLRAYSQASNAAVTQATKQYADDIAAGVAKEVADVKYARVITAQYIDWDDFTNLDAIDWIKDKEDLASLTGVGFRNAASGKVFEVSTTPSYNLKSAMQKFTKNGDWSGEWAYVAPSGATNVPLTTDGIGNLMKYKLSETGRLVDTVPVADLKGALAKYGAGDLMVRIPGSNPLPLTAATVDVIQANPAIGNSIGIYRADWVEDGILTPAEFAQKFASKRVGSRLATAETNLNEAYAIAKSQGFSSRRTVSLFDSWIAKENKAFKDYYSFNRNSSGFYKLLFGPYAYWGIKTGLGNENFSAFMLPDSWSIINVTNSQDNVYQDSFIDFYANEGSDQGDLFSRTINSMLFTTSFGVKALLDTIPSPQVKATIAKVTGQGGLPGSGSMLRDTVKDVAFYSHNEGCSGCSGSFKLDGSYLNLSTISPVELQAFLVEAADETTKKETGTTLVSYAHHTNLSGETGSIEGEKVNLSEARIDGKTCDQKIRGLGLGFGKVFGGAGSSIGFILSASESLGYVINPGFGLIFGTALQQTLIAPELQDCVDDVDGYYIHFYTPPVEENTKSSSTISNETVTSAISDMSDKLNDFVKTNALSNPSGEIKDTNNSVNQSMDKLKEQFDEFSSKSKQSNILQETISLIAPSHGSINGKDIFYIWFKDSAMPIGYKTTGKSVTTDGNMSVEKNYTDGTLKINGNTVLDSTKEDHVRMTSQDNRIPAEVVPMTLNKVAAPKTAEIVFELNTSGEMRVLSAEVINCIRKAIKDQSGLDYTGNELTQVFGNLKQLSTEEYGSVSVMDGKIFLEGKGPRVQGTSYAKFVIDGYWESKLDIDTNKSVDAGKFVGMSFEYGSIVVKPETQELVVWLRQNKNAILTNKDVKSLKTVLSNVTDAETGCEVPAIDLAAVPFANDELGGKKVESFNTSMDLLGPFTQFVTDKRIYEFYAKKDETGTCKNYFRVRDKATGNIITDKEIIGGVTQDADGTLRFKTADGKDNTLNFSAENGVPKVSYNGGAQETLLSAQGQNGSFWYDPDKGLWYPENGLQMPLNQSYKDNGAWFGADENGNVVGLPENKMTFNLGQQAAGGFNLPSLPETTAGIVVFISLFLIISFMLTQGRKNQNQKRVLKNSKRKN